MLRAVLVREKRRKTANASKTQHVTPLKISQPPLPENISTPSEKMSPRENMLTCTTTSLPIHFSSSLYLFFTFLKKNFRGGVVVVEPPPPL